VFFIKRKEHFGCAYANAVMNWYVSLIRGHHQSTAVTSKNEFVFIVMNARQFDGRIDVHGIVSCYSL
jgi:hypothetical protein